MHGGLSPRPLYVVVVDCLKDNMEFAVPVRVRFTISCVVFIYVLSGFAPWRCGLFLRRFGIIYCLSL